MDHFDGPRKKRHSFRSNLIFYGVIILLISLIVAVIALVIWSLVRPIPVVEIRGPIHTGIERAVEMAGGENKFLVIQYGGFLTGGAGAGGIGAPQIFAKSVEQFASLVPPGEPIYTWWETDPPPVKQVYWAFIENRAGLLVWEREYWPGLYALSCEFKYIDEEKDEIVYKEDNYWCDPKPPWYRKEYPLK